MSIIFEVFGFHASDRSANAMRMRRAAHCPFMDCDCDGGGNRYLSSINLARFPKLKSFFKGRSQVPSGVCSLQLRKGERPWIVCPRRLLVLGKEDAGKRRHQEFAELMVLRHSGYSAGIRLGVWPELKIKFDEVSNKSKKHFDYTFDYIIMPLAKASQEEIERETGKSWVEVKPVLEKSGFAFAKRGDHYFIEDFPAGRPLVIEIMTCSTSGGNKDKRTTIPMAFEDAILGREHNAPGINFRQVWARMVSQLIVKSGVAINWGGKTIWILQDVLIDYISSSTALDIRQFLAERTSEVNMLCLSYGNSFTNPRGVMELQDGQLYAGLISSSDRSRDKPSFQDMIRAPICPSKSRLVNLLIKRPPVNVIQIPSKI